jgi:hypothetical protein
MNASEKGHTATAQALIGAGANPNQHTEVSDCCCSYKCLCCLRTKCGHCVTACVCISCVATSCYIGRACCCVSESSIFLSHMDPAPAPTL